MKFISLLGLSVLSTTVSAAVKPGDVSKYPYTRTSMREWVDYFREDESINVKYESSIKYIAYKCPPLYKARIEIAYASGQAISTVETLKTKNLRQMNYIYLIEDGKCGSINVQTVPTPRGSSGKKDQFPWSTPEFTPATNPSASYTETIDLEDVKIGPKEAAEIGRKGTTILKKGFAGMILSKWEYKGTKQPVYTFSQIKGSSQKEEVHISATDGKIYYS